MRTALLSLAIFCFCPYLARADVFPANCSVPVPDISEWKVLSKSRAEFRISDTAAAYLGLDIEYTEYRNPINAGEFVKVTSRHVPLISEQKKLNERVILDTALTLYAQKAEQVRLSELADKVDPVLFMRWRTKENPRTGKNERDGDVDLWFLKFSGECLVAKNKKVATQFLTENVGNGKPRNVFAGVKYQIGDAYHILKVNRFDLVHLTEGER